MGCAPSASIGISDNLTDQEDVANYPRRDLERKSSNSCEKPNQMEMGNTNLGQTKSSAKLMEMSHEISSSSQSREDMSSQSIQDTVNPPVERPSEAATEKNSQPAKQSTTGSSLDDSEYEETDSHDEEDGFDTEVVPPNTNIGPAGRNSVTSTRGPIYPSRFRTTTRTYLVSPVERAVPKEDWLRSDVEAIRKEFAESRMMLALPSGDSDSRRNSLAREPLGRQTPQREYSDIPSFVILQENAIDAAEATKAQETQKPQKPMPSMVMTEMMNNSDHTSSDDRVETTYDFLASGDSSDAEPIASDVDAYYERVGGLTGLRAKASGTSGGIGVVRVFDAQSLSEKSSVSSWQHESVEDFLLSSQSESLDTAKSTDAGANNAIFPPTTAPMRKRSIVSVHSQDSLHHPIRSDSLKDSDTSQDMEEDELYDFLGEDSDALDVHPPRWEKPVAAAVATNAIPISPASTPSKHSQKRIIITPQALSSSSLDAEFIRENSLTGLRLKSTIPVGGRKKSSRLTSHSGSSADLSDDDLIRISCNVSTDSSLSTVEDFFKGFDDSEDTPFPDANLANPIPGGVSPVGINDSEAVDGAETTPSYPSLSRSASQVSTLRMSEEGSPALPTMMSSRGTDSSGPSSVASGNRSTASGPVYGISTGSGSGLGSGSSGGEYVSTHELFESENYISFEKEWQHLKTLKLVFERAGLDASQQKRFLMALKSQTYNGGEYIVREGDEGDAFYIITEGEVVVTKNVDPNNPTPGVPLLDGGREWVITHLYEGHFFGETSLVTKAPRNANVLVPEGGSATCMWISKEDFTPFVEGDEKFRDMIQELVRKKEETSKKRTEMLQSQGGEIVTPEQQREVVRIGVVTRKGRTSDSKMVINDYVFMQKLGAGSFGVVWLAQSLAHSKKYAIKVTSQTNLRRKRFGQSSDEEMLREIAVMKRLQHRNVVALYEVLLDPSTNKFYMVTEYMELGPVMTEREYNFPLRPEVARRYFRDILCGLEYLHFQGVIHRDIKPSNILISSNGVAKIADFGAAALVTDQRGTLRDVKGTPAFQPPEIFDVDNGGTYEGFPVDIWSLGATLHCMVVGVPPYMGANELELVEKLRTQDFRLSSKVQLDPHLLNLLLRCLEKDPAKRITLTEIMTHDWVTEEGAEPLITCPYVKLDLEKDKVDFDDGKGFSNTEDGTVKKSSRRKSKSSNKKSSEGPSSKRKSKRQSMPSNDTDVLSSSTVDDDLSSEVLVHSMHSLSKEDSMDKPKSASSASDASSITSSLPTPTQSPPLVRKESHYKPLHVFSSPPDTAGTLVGSPMDEITSDGGDNTPSKDALENSLSSTSDHRSRSRRFLASSNRSRSRPISLSHVRSFSHIPVASTPQSRTSVSQLIPIQQPPRPVRQSPVTPSTISSLYALGSDQAELKEALVRISATAVPRPLTEDQAEDIRRLRIRQHLLLYGHSNLPESARDALADQHRTAFHVARAQATVEDLHVDSSGAFIDTTPEHLTDMKPDWSRSPVYDACMSASSGISPVHHSRDMPCSADGSVASPDGDISDTVACFPQIMLHSPSERPAELQTISPCASPFGPISVTSNGIAASPSIGTAGRRDSHFSCRGPSPHNTPGQSIPPLPPSRDSLPRTLQRTRDFLMVTSNVDQAEGGGSVKRTVIFQAKGAEGSLSITGGRAGISSRHILDAGSRSTSVSGSIRTRRKGRRDSGSSSLTIGSSSDVQGFSPLTSPSPSTSVASYSSHSSRPGGILPNGLALSDRRLDGNDAGAPENPRSLKRAPTFSVAKTTASQSMFDTSKPLRKSKSSACNVSTRTPETNRLSFFGLSEAASNTWNIAPSPQSDEEMISSPPPSAFPIQSTLDAGLVTEPYQRLTHCSFDSTADCFNDDSSDDSSDESDDMGDYSDSSDEDYEDVQTLDDMEDEGKLSNKLEELLEDLTQNTGGVWSAAQKRFDELTTAFTAEEMRLWAIKRSKVSVVSTLLSVHLESIPSKLFSLIPGASRPASAASNRLSTLWENYSDPDISSSLTEVVQNLIAQEKSHVIPPSSLAPAKVSAWNPILYDGELYICPTGHVSISDWHFVYSGYGSRGSRSTMEDRFVCIGSLRHLLHCVNKDIGAEVTPECTPERDLSFFAVYDGHSGTDTAETLEQTLHFRIAERLGLIRSTEDLSKRTSSSNTEIVDGEFGFAGKAPNRKLLKTIANSVTNVSSASFSGIVGTDEDSHVYATTHDVPEAILWASEELDHELQMDAQPGTSISGSTAIMAVLEHCHTEAGVKNTVLHCANVGDSRAVLCRSGEAVALSIDHTCENPAEKERVLAAGGSIIKGRINGVLAVTRAFGDAEHKKMRGEGMWEVQYSSDPLSAIPEIYSCTITPEDEFVILACDGLWDVMTSSSAVQFVRRRLLMHGDVGRVSVELVHQAIALGSIDNVSAIVVALNSTRK